MSEYWIDISDMKRNSGNISCSWVSEIDPPPSHTKDTEFIKVIEKSKHEQIVEQLQAENATIKEREAKLKAKLDLALSTFKNHALDCSAYTVSSYERLLDKLEAMK